MLLTGTCGFQLGIDDGSWFVRAKAAAEVGVPKRLSVLSVSHQEQRTLETGHCVLELVTRTRLHIYSQQHSFCCLLAAQRQKSLW
jgi:hypothetical protein